MRTPGLFFCIRSSLLQCLYLSKFHWVLQCSLKCVSRYLVLIHKYPLFTQRTDDLVASCLSTLRPVGLHKKVVVDWTVHVKDVLFVTQTSLKPDLHFKYPGIQYNNLYHIAMAMGWLMVGYILDIHLII